MCVLAIFIVWAQKCSPYRRTSLALSTPAGGLGKLFSSVSIALDRQFTASAAANIAGSAWASSFSASFSIAAAPALAVEALSASMLAAACCFSAVRSARVIQTMYIRRMF